MKGIVLGLAGALILLGGLHPAHAENLKDQVRVEVSKVGLHPGIDPGVYVCGGGHLHVVGTVQNQAAVPLGQVKVAGKAFDATGKVLGTATAATKVARLAPGEKAEINLEFLTVTGLRIERVKRQEISVTEAPTAQ